jgi:hypothetical protein
MLYLASDIIHPFIMGKMCRHGMCGTCLVAVINTALLTKSLDCLFQCSGQYCKAKYEIYQFREALLVFKDPQIAAKIREIDIMQTNHAYVMTQQPGDILL